MSSTEKKKEADSFKQHAVEGDGYFVLNDGKQEVTKGDLIVVPAGTKYTFGGNLKMLLINTPKWSAEQEEIEKLSD